jgi:hypothetical protein
MRPTVAALLVLFLPLVAVAQEPADSTTVAQGLTALRLPTIDFAAADQLAALAPRAFAQPQPRRAPQPRPADTGSRRRPSMVGYIEDAGIHSQIRLRFDAGFGNTAPDRAEFFYAKCGCFKTWPVPYIDPEAPGPGGAIPTELNFQQFYSFGEIAVRDRFSLFAELPVRALQPDGFITARPPWPDRVGVSDLRFGAKAALLADDSRTVTFQLRASAPTGDASKGMGTHNFSLEPALLYHQDITERFGLEAQIGDSHPFDGSRGPTTDSADFSGDVFFYGIGPSFDLVTTDRVRFTPVFELVGWRVLGGFQTDCRALACFGDAKGINVVNVKVGARTTVANRNSIYVGMGWGLTDEVWYDKLFRLEYRLGF